MKDIKVGIMQPYFLPYIGYWQLMNAVDKYVILDDVNYINRGWINRNRILVNGEPKYLTIPLQGASQNKKINDILIGGDPSDLAKNLRKVESSYKKAPYFEQVFPIVEQILTSDEKWISQYNYNTFRLIGAYLDIDTEIYFSSELDKDDTLKGQDRILDICKRLGATQYYNAVGGKQLYSAEAFAKEQIRLHFLETETITYKQFDSDFQPNLSILDVMMFNSPEQIQEMLHKFVLT